MAASRNAFIGYKCLDKAICASGLVVLMRNKSITMLLQCGWPGGSLLFLPFPARRPSDCMAMKGSLRSAVCTRSRGNPRSGSQKGQTTCQLALRQLRGQLIQLQTIASHIIVREVPYTTKPSMSSVLLVGAAALPGHARLGSPCEGHGAALSSVLSCNSMEVVQVFKTHRKFKRLRGRYANTLKHLAVQVPLFAQNGRNVHSYCAA